MSNRSDNLAGDDSDFEEVTGYKTAEEPEDPVDSFLDDLLGEPETKKSFMNDIDTKIADSVNTLVNERAAKIVSQFLEGGLKAAEERLMKKIEAHLVRQAIGSPRPKQEKKVTQEQPIVKSPETETETQPPLKRTPREQTAQAMMKMLDKPRVAREQQEKEQADAKVKPAPVEHITMDEHCANIMRQLRIPKSAAMNVARRSWGTSATLKPKQ